MSKLKINKSGVINIPKNIANQLEKEVFFTIDKNRENVIMLSNHEIDHSSIKRTITQSGQVTIPENFRINLNINESSSLSIDNSVFNENYNKNWFDIMIDNPLTFANIYELIEDLGKKQLLNKDEFMQAMAGVSNSFDNVERAIKDYLKMTEFSFDSNELANNAYDFILLNVYPLIYLMKHCQEQQFNDMQIIDSNVFITKDNERKLIYNKINTMYLSKNIKLLTDNNSLTSLHLNKYRLFTMGSPLSSKLYFHAVKHESLPNSLDLLVKSNSIDDDAKTILSEAIKNKLNIVITGSTGAGKTTVMNALINEIEPLEKIVVLEDSKEMEILNESSKMIISLLKSELNEKDKSYLLELNPDYYVLADLLDNTDMDLYYLLASCGHTVIAGLHAMNAKTALNNMSITLLKRIKNISEEKSFELIDSCLDIVVELQHLSDGIRKISNIYGVVINENTKLKTVKLVNLYCGNNCRKNTQLDKDFIHKMQRKNNFLSIFNT